MNSGTFHHVAVITKTEISLTNGATTNETKEATPVVLSLTAALHGVNAVTVTGPRLEAKGEGVIKCSGATTSPGTCIVTEPIERAQFHRGELP